MNVDYNRLSDALETTIEELKAGTKNPQRTRRVSLRVGAGLEGFVSNGDYEYGIDAAVDAGGEGKYARPMDYVLGGLLGCMQMWCLRFAATARIAFDDLVLRADGHFTWRGEYLEEVDAGLTALDIHYRVAAPDLDGPIMQAMMDTVARRCPVFATLRKAVPIDEHIVLNGQSLGRRRWIPGEKDALCFPDGRC